VIWNDIPSEIEVLQYLNLTQDVIWNTGRTCEMDHPVPLTQTEYRRIQEDQSKEGIVKERFWWIPPDGISVLPPVVNTYPSEES
jgi:hypothetical protein